MKKNAKLFQQNSNTELPRKIQSWVSPMGRQETHNFEIWASALAGLLPMVTAKCEV